MEKDNAPDMAMDESGQCATGELHTENHMEQEGNGKDEAPAESGDASSQAIDRMGRGNKKRERLEHVGAVQRKTRLGVHGEG
jgi:hypothetical protein